MKKIRLAQQVISAIVTVITGISLLLPACGSPDWIEQEQLPVTKSVTVFKLNNQSNQSAQSANVTKNSNNGIALREDYHEYPTDWIDSRMHASGAADLSSQIEVNSAHNYPPQHLSASPANPGTLLKGQVTYCVPRGTPIKLKIATVPKLGLRMLQRDMDGNLASARVNQEITAKTTEDIFVDENKVIPLGTIFHGRVTKIIPPKRVGRPGSLILAFESFTRPDGHSFAFRAEANNTRESTRKSKAKGFGRIMAHAGGGAIVGAIVAYSLMGLQETIAMHGYNIAAGAAAGALFGTAVALIKHGPDAVLEPGDDLNMEIDTDLLVPAAMKAAVRPPATNFPGLVIQVNKAKVIKDGLDGYMLQLDALVTNDTNNRLDSIDLFIEDDNGNRYPLVSDDREDKTDMLFIIDPHSDMNVRCDFEVEYPKMKHTLVWLDHDSHQILIRQKLQ